MKGAFRAGALASGDPLPLARLLYRGIRLKTLLSKNPPEPLFASAAENRYNVQGVATLYFGENVLTAYAESVQIHAGLLIDHPTRERATPAGCDITQEGEEPIVIFAAGVSLQRVIDLTDSGIRLKLGVTEDSLIGPWRWEALLGCYPLCQQLGNGIYEDGRFEAIRYPSEKAHQPNRASAHANWAIFVERLDAESIVAISDASRTLQGRLPLPARRNPDEA